MPPPRFSNPPPKTESARSAVKAFYSTEFFTISLRLLKRPSAGELCQKGYARMNEWEAHEGSYDHQHRKRLKELSRMQRDPNATNKARERERKEDEKSGIGGLSFKPVKLGGAADGSSGTATSGGGLSKGFKKGGFKSAFGGGEVVVDVPASDAALGAGAANATDLQAGERMLDHEDADSESDGESYDPTRPTGCDGSCMARHTR